jgi:hypothetical protein
MLLAQLETPPEVLSTSTPEILPPPEDLAPPMAPQEALLGAGLPVAGSQENIICDFYTPLAIKKVGGQTAKLIYPDQDNANFQFASSSCYAIYPATQNNASSSLYEQITNPASSTQSFFLEKVLTYGDILMAIFFTLFLYAWLGKSLFNFFLKKWH